MKTKANQPTFLYSKDKLPVKAGGVIFYYIDENMMVRFLLLHSRGRYEDFGGKTDIKDTCYEDTVAREVEEESNNIFKKEDIKKKIKDLEPIYTKHSKYIIYFIKLDSDIDSALFGDKEIYENIPRTVEWVTASELKSSKFIKDKLNFRLRFKDFFEKINEILIEINNELMEDLEMKDLEETLKEL